MALMSQVVSMIQGMLKKKGGATGQPTPADTKVQPSSAASALSQGSALDQASQDAVSSSEKKKKTTQRALMGGAASALTGGLL